MTNYTSGRRYEWKVMEILRSEGYYCVRAAGSHSKIDVIGLRTIDGEIPIVRAIQSRSGNSPSISKSEMDEIQELRRKTPDIVQFELWLWTKGRSIPEIVIIRKDKALEL